jgi:hypothetical protein
MVVVMMITMCIRIIFQITLRESFCCRVRRALNTGIEFYTRIGQRHLRAHADATADQRVNFLCLKESGQRAVSASIGVYYLFSRDPAILRVIQLELLRMSEMMENLSIFVGDCDSHTCTSFLHDCLINLNRFIFTASACDQQPLAVNKNIRDFFPCAVLYCRNRGAGDIHNKEVIFLSINSGFPNHQH